MPDLEGRSIQNPLNKKLGLEWVIRKGLCPKCLVSHFLTSETFLTISKTHSCFQNALRLFLAHQTQKHTLTLFICFFPSLFSLHGISGEYGKIAWLNSHSDCMAASTCLVLSSRPRLGSLIPVLTRQLRLSPPLPRLPVTAGYVWLPGGCWCPHSQSRDSCERMILSRRHSHSSGRPWQGGWNVLLESSCLHR